ncbi:hypothetical protein [Trueperella pyogenes]|uniref:hypothetical protein n=1 Tax=Trueperella pyogenes TaxID=1661 RepID=UPI003DAA1771
MIIAPANQGDVLEGDGWKFDGNSITAPLSTPTGGRLQLQGLSPARKYRVNIAFNVGTGQSTGKTYLRVQGQIYNFPAGTYPALTYRTFEIDPSRPALIEFKGEPGAWPVPNLSHARVAPRRRARRPAPLRSHGVAATPTNCLGEAR